MTKETMNCPKCETECWREEADVGVGIIYGPWGCPDCGWSESEEYDLTTRSPGPDAKGGYIDQYGGYWPAGSSRALAYRMAAEAEKKDPSP